MKNGNIIFGALAFLGIFCLFVALTLVFNTRLITDVKNKMDPEQQSPQVPADEFSNWNTYINPNREFSFRYPSNWFLAECGSTTNIYLNSAQKSCDSGPNSFSINVIYFQNGEIGFGGERERGTLTTESKLLVDSQEVIQGEIDESKASALNIKYTQTKIKIKNGVYNFILYDQSQKYTYDTILNTFKFLD